MLSSSSGGYFSHSHPAFDRIGSLTSGSSTGGSVGVTSGDLVERTTPLASALDMDLLTPMADDGLAETSASPPGCADTPMPGLDMLERLTDPTILVRCGCEMIPLSST